MRLAEYYDDLSRLEHAKNRHVMHKPFAVGPSLDLWIKKRVAAFHVTSLLDVGCGFGTTLDVLAELPGLERAHGITISAFQKSIADDRKRHEKIEIYLGNYEDPLPQTYDAIVSIESLVFARDLAGALSNLSRHLSSSGRLFVVEDMGNTRVVSPLEAPYREGFCLQHVFRDDDFREAFDASGLTVEDELDLTPRLALGRSRLASVRGSLLSALKRILPSPRWSHILAAYWGGTFLERLYAEGLFSYKFYQLQKRRHA
jgi:SAM-dependent methyltransferase